MRMIMWLLTISFALAGLALRADHGVWFGPAHAYLGPAIAQGLFILAALSCPFLWARKGGFMPDGLRVPGKQRLFMALALILSAPLILPWPF